MTCRPRIPYQVHVLDRIREYVETLFNRFRNAVNGRLGFQYRQIVWDIADCPDLPGHFPFTVFQGLPHLRWEEASRLLDTLFRHRHVIVVGNGAAGKTTMMASFVVPQLRHISPNVFYAEIWDHPVHEMREAIEKAGLIPPGGAVDIISICKKLLTGGPCFFIIDGCERLKTVDPDEWEKLERFVGFCLEHENAYLAVLGDKEEFFSWYEPFKGMSLSAVFEVGPVDRPDAALLPRPEEALSLEIVKEKVDEALRAAADRNELRETVSLLAGNGAKTLRRFSLEEIHFETRIPKERISLYLSLLEEKGIARRQDASATAFWTLSSRQLKEHLYQYLGLDEFARKREMREVLRAAGEEGRFLDAEHLDMIEDLQHGMMFTKKEMGLILGSMVFHGRDWTPLLDKAENEVRGFDFEPVLPLLARDEAEIREAALRLLARARDDALVNPLLAHLRRETVARAAGLSRRGLCRCRQEEDHCRIDEDACGNGGQGRKDQGHRCDLSPACEDRAQPAHRDSERGEGPRADRQGGLLAVKAGRVILSPHGTDGYSWLFLVLSSHSFSFISSSTARSFSDGSFVFVLSTTCSLTSFPFSMVRKTSRSKMEPYPMWR